MRKNQLPVMHISFSAEDYIMYFHVWHYWSDPTKYSPGVVKELT